MFTSTNHEIKIMKDIRRKNKENVGHAIGNRVRILFFLRYKIFKLKMFEGVEATLDQFYLNRSLNDLKRLIKNINQDLSDKVKFSHI